MSKITPPGPNYKMSKTDKMKLASILDPHKKGQFKRAVIEAHLFAQETAKQVEKSKNKSENT